MSLYLDDLTPHDFPCRRQASNPIVSRAVVLGLEGVSNTLSVHNLNPYLTVRRKDDSPVGSWGFVLYANKSFASRHPTVVQSSVQAWQPWKV